jgi:signal transduction histidine kinase
MPESLAPAGPAPLETLRGEPLEALLDAISDAPDFATAAERLTRGFAVAAGARRACLYVMNEALDAFELAVMMGEPDVRPPERISIGDVAHPVVVSGLSLFALGNDPRFSAGDPPPFAPWLVVPFPQPQFRDAPTLLAEGEAVERARGRCVLQVAQPGERRRRTGLAPHAVVVLETPASTGAAAALQPAATLAGPILARIAAVERYRHTAERLDRQRDLLTDIINSLPDPIVIAAAPGTPGDGTVVQNRRAAHLFLSRAGDPEGRLRAVDINTLLFAAHLAAPPAPPAAAATDDGASATGAPLGAEVRGTEVRGTEVRDLTLADPVDGRDLLFEASEHALSPGSGMPTALRMTVLRDVTDLRRAADELARQVRRVRLAEVEATRERDRLDLILENVADPILVTDADARIVQTNRQADSLFAAESQDADPTATSLPYEAAAAMRRNAETLRAFVAEFVASPEQARRARMSLTHAPTGAPFPAEIVSGKIAGRAGEPPVVVSVLHDLTKQAENERLYEELKGFSAELEVRVRLATADLAEQNARLQWQSQELEKANRLKSEFLASMSHELRTPINALMGYTALLLDRVYGELNAKQDEGLQRIQTSAQHLLALINGILDLAKIEAGKMPVNVERVVVPLVVLEVSQQIEPLLRKKGLELVSAMAPDMPPIQSDRTKLKQILLNLASNAVKFTPAGRVTIAASVADGKLHLAVSDTGIGIRPEDLELIWEDFRQLDQSRTREYGGTGLGLSITRKLVERLGGEISVRSEFGVGSTFSVTLPIEEQKTEDRSQKTGERHDTEDRSQETE